MAATTSTSVLPGIVSWALGIRMSMVCDPGRQDLEDQIQNNGFRFLEEYLDNIQGGTEDNHVVDLLKTPGRKAGASKSRTLARVGDGMESLETIFEAQAEPVESPCQHAPVKPSQLKMVIAGAGDLAAIQPPSCEPPEHKVPSSSPFQDDPNTPCEIISKPDEPLPADKQDNCGDTHSSPSRCGAPPSLPPPLEAEPEKFEEPMERPKEVLTSLPMPDNGGVSTAAVKTTTCNEPVNSKQDYSGSWESINLSESQTVSDTPTSVNAQSSNSLDQAEHSLTNPTAPAAPILPEARNFTTPTNSDQFIPPCSNRSTGPSDPVSACRREVSPSPSHVPHSMEDGVPRAQLHEGPALPKDDRHDEPTVSVEERCCASQETQLHSGSDGTQMEITEPVCNSKPVDAESTKGDVPTSGLSVARGILGTASKLASSLLVGIMKGKEGVEGKTTELNDTETPDARVRTEVDETRKRTWDESVEETLQKNPETSKKRKTIEPGKLRDMKKPTAKEPGPSRIGKPTPTTKLTKLPPSSHLKKPAAKPTMKATTSKKIVGKGKSKAEDLSMKEPSQIVAEKMQSRVKAQLDLVKPLIAPESIELPDVNSDYSDSEDEGRARTFDPPKWAKSPELREALEAQSKWNPDLIFGDIPPLRMEELFKDGRKFRNRTSSAVWDELTVEEMNRYTKAMGFDS